MLPICFEIKKTSCQFHQVVIVGRFLERSAEALPRPGRTNIRACEIWFVPHICANSMAPYVKQEFECPSEMVAAYEHDGVSKGASTVALAVNRIAIRLCFLCHVDWFCVRHHPGFYQHAFIALTEYCFLNNYKANVGDPRPHQTERNALVFSQKQNMNQKIHLTSGPGI